MKGGREMSTDVTGKSSWKTIVRKPPNTTEVQFVPERIPIALPLKLTFKQIGTNSTKSKQTTKTKTTSILPAKQEPTGSPIEMSQSPIAPTFKFCPNRTASTSLSPIPPIRPPPKTCSSSSPFSLSEYSIVKKQGAPPGVVVFRRSSGSKDKTSMITPTSTLGSHSKRGDRGYNKSTDGSLRADSSQCGSPTVNGDSAVDYVISGQSPEGVREDASNPNISCVNTNLSLVEDHVPTALDNTDAKPRTRSRLGSRLSTSTESRDVSAPKVTMSFPSHHVVKSVPTAITTVALEQLVKSPKKMPTGRLTANTKRRLAETIEMMDEIEAATASKFKRRRAVENKATSGMASDDLIGKDKSIVGKIEMAAGLHSNECNENDKLLHEGEKDIPHKEIDGKDNNMDPISIETKETADILLAGADIKDMPTVDCTIKESGGIPLDNTLERITNQNQDSISSPIGQYEINSDNENKVSESGVERTDLEQTALLVESCVKGKVDRKVDEDVVEEVKEEKEEIILDQKRVMEKDDEECIDSVKVVGNRKQEGQSSSKEIKHEEERELSTSIDDAHIYPTRSHQREDVQPDLHIILMDIDTSKVNPIPLDTLSTPSSFYQSNNPNTTPASPTHVTDPAAAASLLVDTNTTGSIKGEPETETIPMSGCVNDNDTPLAKGQGDSMTTSSSTLKDFPDPIKSKETKHEPSSPSYTPSMSFKETRLRRCKRTARRSERPSTVNVNVATDKPNTNTAVWLELSPRKTRAQKRNEQKILQQIPDLQLASDKDSSIIDTPVAIQPSKIDKDDTNQTPILLRNRRVIGCSTDPKVGWAGSNNPTGVMTGPPLGAIPDSTLGPPMRMGRSIAPRLLAGPVPPGMRHFPRHPITNRPLFPLAPMSALCGGCAQPAPQPTMCHICGFCFHRLCTEPPLDPMAPRELWVCTACRARMESQNTTSGNNNEGNSWTKATKTIRNRNPTEFRLPSWHASIVGTSKLLAGTYNEDDLSFRALYLFNKKKSSLKESQSVLSTGEANTTDQNDAKMTFARRISQRMKDKEEAVSEQRLPANQKEILIKPANETSGRKRRLTTNYNQGIQTTIPWGIASSSPSSNYSDESLGRRGRRSSTEDIKKVQIKRETRIGRSDAKATQGPRGLGRIVSPPPLLASDPTSSPFTPRLRRYIQPCSLCGDSKPTSVIISCSQCPLSYHTACINPPIKTPVTADWTCPHHKTANTTNSSANSRSRKRFKKPQKLPYMSVRLDFTGQLPRTLSPTPEDNSAARCLFDLSGRRRNTQLTNELIRNDTNRDDSLSPSLPCSLPTDRKALHDMFEQFIHLRQQSANIPLCQ